MSFFGYVGSGLRASFEVDRDLTQNYACALGRQRLALFGYQEHVISGAQGALLFGGLFHPERLASELRAESDNQPALLLHAYRRWGVDFPSHVPGEYAFVLWDSNSRRALLGRDPSGGWPLYYTQRGKDLVFADTIRYLLERPGGTAALNERRIAQWLAIHPESAPETFFEGILRILPGTTLLYEDGRLTVHDFWHPERTPLLKLRDGREYAEGLIDVLDHAVQDRIRACSPIGSQLSGGMDSSSVTVTAARLLGQGGRELSAFTAVPEHAVEIPGRFTDEGPHAAAVAAMYPNIDHVLVRHGAHSVFSLIDRFNSAQEEPIFNPANYDWSYEICLQAQQRGIKTLLVGDLGNLTISYSGDRALQSLLQEGRLLAFASLAGDLHRYGSRRWRGMAHELLRPWMPVYARDAIDRRRGRFAATHEYSMIRRDFVRRHDLGLMTLEEGHIRLHSRALRALFLRRNDFGPAIAALRRLTGVGRTDPTSDRRVIEYCLSVPVEYYCERGVPRSLLRNAMIGRLPEPVRTERRKGLQAADFTAHFAAERAEALAELERLKKVDLAARAMDLPAMRAMLQLTPAQIAERGGMVKFWPKLLRAFSLGRFLRRWEDGTLFMDRSSRSALTVPAGATLLSKQP
jgi:asparagine synthase (glutamine-hydrolysing)